MVSRYITKRYGLGPKKKNWTPPPFIEMHVSWQGSVRSYIYWYSANSPTWHIYRMYNYHLLCKQTSVSVITYLKHDGICQQKVVPHCRNSPWEKIRQFQKNVKENKWCPNISNWKFINSTLTAWRLVIWISLNIPKR
jgi:hypothetical protein